MGDQSLKTHHVRDASHDGYEVSTACGIDGWRKDGLSQWYFRRGSDDRMFHAAFEASSVTCKRCLSTLLTRSVAADDFFKLKPVGTNL